MMTFNLICAIALAQAPTVDPKAALISALNDMEKSHFSGVLYLERDGKEIFYRAGDALMAVSIQTKPMFVAETPQRLFSGRFTGAGQDRSFDVTTDRKKFVMVQSDPAANLQQLHVVQNWFAELKRQSPARK